jgi:outer membrane protein assembly factor BamB
MRKLRSSLPWPIVISCLIVSPVPTFGDPWPRFRGPNGSGISADRDVPIEWTAKQGILWKTPILGVGNSSPVVWGDRIFLQSATTDGKERLLLCLSTADGSVRWKQVVEGGRARMHPRNTLASSTPATDGRRVYAIVWDGKEVSAHAYDLEGTPVWSADLGGFVSQHGAGMSPIVIGDKVIVANDQDGSSTLVALEANSGKVAWQCPRKLFRACYSTPFALERSEEPPQLIAASTAGITSYDPGTGKENWNWKWTFSGMPLRTVASPLYHDGMVFANSGDGSGARHAVAIGAPANRAAGNHEIVWEKQRGFPYVPTMLAWGEHLFYVNDDGIASCLVAKSGEPVWTERLGGKVSASPILIDGKIYVANEDGTTYVFPASPRFELLAKSPLGETVIATPAVSDGRLYIRGKEHLFCIGRAGKRTAGR